MAIPDTTPFQSLLRSFALSPPESTHPYESRRAVDGEVVTSTQPSPGDFESSRPVSVLHTEPVDIWYRTDAGIAFDSLLRKLSTELRARQHESSSTVVLALVAAFTSVKRLSANPVKQLNALLDCVTSTEVTQVAALPGEAPADYRALFPSFEIGRLNWDRLARLCERAGSDFHKRHGERLRASFGVERSRFVTGAVDWPSFGSRHLSRGAQEGIGPGSPTYSLIDAYYNTLARQLNGSFWDALLAEQHLLLAAGAPYVDERVLRNLPLLQFVTIFYWQSKRTPAHGWVCPSVAAQLHIDLARSDQRIREVRERLRLEFAIEALDADALHPSVFAYARFLSRARRHALDRRSEEAFVHYVIALDLLLGSTEASSKSVSERVAVIVFQEFGMPFDGAVRQMRTLYDVRSKYVHEGRHVEAERVEDVTRIATSVLFALLRFLARRGGSKVIDLGDSWHRELDLYIASLNAGRDVTSLDWAAVGVVPITSGH